MNIEMYNDSFQNWKRYLSCKAQLIISDPPYMAANCGRNAYGFEIKKEFCRAFETELRPCIQTRLFL